jgi:hypothetical protein
MPRKPIDYKNAIIYKITNADESLIYVGSTTEYRRRKSEHKSKCNNENHKSYHHYVYQMIRDNGGWNAFEMKPIKEFPCENKIQLLIEEERIRKELNANLNKYRAITTAEERAEYNAEYHKTYAEANKEAMVEYKKTYKQANKEAIAEKDKAYKQANKEAIAEKDKAYREANKERIKEVRKIYLESKKTQSNLM